MTTEILIFILSGIAIGMCAGLFGGGTGVFSVPAMLFIIEHYSNLPSYTHMHFAIGSSIAVSAICFLGAFYRELKNKTAIPKKILWINNFSGIIFVVPAMMLAAIFSGNTLKLVFASVLLLTALTLYLPPASEKNVAFLNRTPIFFIFSGIANMLGTLTGVGGGAFVLPILQRMGINLNTGVSLIIRSGAFVLPFMALGFVVLGAKQGFFAIKTWGFIDVIPSFTLGFISLCVSMFAVKLRQKLPAALLKNLFCLLLISLAIYMAGKVYF
ncbi:MAG: hypothetical protein K0S08_587 [Gammaproteobacteria bacterium]|nr:hypothetical protein [Gammaproteobacteria bacterium]